MLVLARLCILISFFLNSCSFTRKGIGYRKTQVIEYVTKQFYPGDTNLLNPFWTFTDKVWFNDSFAIEEVRSLSINEDGKGKTTEEYKIKHYRFTDLRKGFICEFRSFSDTASLIRKYSFRDSVLLIGGWGFNYPRHGDGLLEILSDTLINNVGLKRAKVLRSSNGQSLICICYLSCEKKGTVFDLDTFVSEKSGCPVIMTHTFSPLKKGLNLTSEVIFIADTLSQSEKAVFNAWKKFAEQNPSN